VRERVGEGEMERRDGRKKGWREEKT